MKFIAHLLMAITLIACDPNSARNTVEFFTGPAFTGKDIETVKTQINSLYSAKGTKVSNIVLIKETSTKLSGYAEVTANILGTEMEMTHNCSAVMGEDRQILLKCLPF